MSLLPQEASLLQDDEEWLSRLIIDSQAIESFPSALFIERFLNDHDTSRYADWVDRVQKCGFVVPQDIAQVQRCPSPVSVSTQPAQTQLLPARLTESFGQAITLLLSVPRHTAVQLITTTLAASSIDITEDEFEPGLELVLKIVECYHRQRMARLGVLIELLRLEQTAGIEEDQPNNDSTSSSSAVNPLIAAKAKQILQQLDPCNLFGILLSAAVPRDDNASTSSSLSRPQREALQALPRQSSYASFVANFAQIQTIFFKLQQIKAMEALIGLCYDHVTVQRVHLALVSIVLPEPSEALVGMWGIEGLALWKDTQHHPLLQGVHAHDELRALAKIWQRHCLASKPYTLMVMGLGLLLKTAQLPEGTTLLETANDQDAFGNLYQVLIELIPPRSCFPDPDEDDEDKSNNELDAASLMYAGIGREIVSAAITVFSDNLKDADNVDIFCLLASAVTQNSPTMTQQFWVDWAVYTKTSEERPFCVLLDRAHQLAQHNHVVPFLRLLASIVSTPESVRIVLEDFVPPHLFSNVLQSNRKNEDNTIVLLESIHALASRATTIATRQKLCSILDPKLVWKVVLECSSERASKAGMELLSLLLRDNTPWTESIARSFHWISGELWHSIMLRGNLSARAAAHFLSSLFQNMTPIFFAPTTNETFILDFLGYFRHALMSLSSLLSSSVPMLSKPVLVGQKQLTYRSAAAIMNCIRMTLQYAGPMEALHPSAVVCRAAADFRWSILTSISGKSILFYATVPVSLGIARLLDETVRNAQLLQMRNKSDLFQNWLSAAKQDAAVDPDFQLMIKETLEKPDKLFFDFSDMSFPHEDSAKMPLRAASSAIDLLQLWSNVLESRETVDLDREMTACPHILLSSKGDLPQINPTTSRDVSAIWNKSAISYAGFFARYCQSESAGNDNVEDSITHKAMELLVTLTRYSASRSDDRVFSAIFESTSLTLRLRKEIESVLGTIGETQPRRNTQCFEILAHCASFRPHELSQILSGRAWKNLASCIQKVCSDAVTWNQSGRPVGTMLTDIDLGKASLQLLLSWRIGSSRVGMDDNFEIYSGVLLLLPGFLINCLPSEDSDSAFEMLMDFRRLVIDFLNHEFSTLLISSPLRIKERERKLISDLESSFGRNLSALSSLSKYYLHVRYLSTFLTMYDHHFGIFGHNEGKSMMSTMQYFIKSSNRLGEDNIDTKFFSAWVKALRLQTSISVTEMTKVYNRFMGENSVLLAWKSILTTFAVLDKAEWRDSEQSQLDSLELIKDSLVSILRILEMLERIQPQFLVLDLYQNTITRLAFMPLCAVSMDDNWIEVIRLIAECCRKLAKSCLPPNDFLTGTKHLLACSVVVLKAVQPSSYNEAHVVDVCVSFSEVVCQLIKTIEQFTVLFGDHFNHQYLDCLSICISVLAALTPPPGSSISTWGGLSGINERLHSLFKDYNVIQSLSLQVSSLMKNESFSSSAQTSICESILLVLTFVSKLAVIGDADLLSLLVESEITLLLPKRAQFTFHTHESFPMRGYIEKSKLDQLDVFDREKEKTNVSSLERGLENPHHKVWRASIKFVAASLRSATDQKYDSQTRSKYYTLALDFLSANKATILSCLQQCSSIYFNQENPVLTLNALEEAGLILALASDLCTNGSLEVFRIKYLELYDTLVTHSKSLLASLSCFIGSSAASRDLFSCIDRLEDADAMALDSIPHLAELGHMFFTLAGGISNARHEAIRYSHFVSRCSAPVTLVDVTAQGTFPPGYQVHERLRTNSDPHSLNSLEHKCREAVINSFAFQLEVKAAEALFHAVQIIWRTHPTASSLVTIQEKEWPLHDSMPTIKEGTIVAIQADSTTQIPQSSPRNTSLVEIVRCDTVNRRWEVCSWQDGVKVYSIVNQKQIVAIEDSTLRHGILSSAPALRSSAELEKSVGTASIGHLILALRWCGRSQNKPDECNHVAKRLAEICTFLLSTEITVHRESGTLTSAPEILSLQLMDLYGERVEFATLLENFTGPLFDDQRGRLLTVLDEDIWIWVREQLHEEMQQATNHLKNRGQGRSSTTSSRYSTNSPRRHTVRALGY